MPAPFAVFRVFAHANVHFAVVNDRRADDVVAIGPVQRVFRFLRIAVELPQEFRFAAFAARIEAVEPAVAGAEDHLRLAAEHGVSGRRPLAVQHVRSGRIVGPEHFARVFIDAQ